MARIRELQALLGLNLDEIAIVLRNEDRIAEIRPAITTSGPATMERRGLIRECLALQEDLRATVEAKRGALDDFLTDLDARIRRAGIPWPGGITPRTSGPGQDPGCPGRRTAIGVSCSMAWRARTSQPE